MITCILISYRYQGYIGKMVPIRIILIYFTPLNKAQRFCLLTTGITLNFGNILLVSVSALYVLIKMLHSVGVIEIGFLLSLCGIVSAFTLATF
jgi:hypothetical protein